MLMDLKGQMALQAVKEGPVATMTTRVKMVPVARTTVEPPEELKEMLAQEVQTRPTLLRIGAGIFLQPKQPSRPLKTQILTLIGPSAITLSVSILRSFHLQKSNI